MPLPEDEVTFLILHYLRALNRGDRLSRATANLESALSNANLLPSEPDFTGAFRTLSYEQCASRLSHIPPDYLSTALTERIPHAPIPVRTLFGKGAFSTVPKSECIPDSVKEQNAIVESHHGLQAYQRRFGRNIKSIPGLLEQQLILDRPLPIANITYAILPKEMRRLKRLVGHHLPVYCALYDFSSQYIVTGSDDHHIKVWSTKTGYLCHTLRGHDRDINDIVSVPGRRIIVSASGDSTIRVWDIVTGENLHVLRGGSKDVNVVQFSPSPDRPYLLAGCADGAARLWNSENYGQGELRLPLPISTRRGETAATSSGLPRVNNSRSPTFGDSSGAGPSSTAGVTSGERESIPASSLPSTPVDMGSPPATANNRTLQPSQVQPSAPRTNIRTGSRPQGVQNGASSRQLGAASNAANSVVSGTPSYEVLSVAFNTGATRLAISGTDCMAHVFSVDKGEEVASLPAVQFLTSLRGHSDSIYQVIFARQSDRICTAARDGTARVWRRVCARLPQKRRLDANSGMGTWKSILLDCRPRNQDVRSSLSVGASGAPSTSITPRVHRGRYPTSVDAVMWSLHDDYIVSASSDSKIRVWSSETGELHHVLQAHDRAVYVIDANPLDKRIVLTAGYDGRCVLWDIEKGVELRRFSVAKPGLTRNPAATVSNGFDPSIMNGKFSPDGFSFSVTDTSGAVTIFGVDSGESMALAPEEQFFSNDFVPYRKDALQRAISEDNGTLLHLVPKGDLCDSQIRRHPPELQIDSQCFFRHLLGASDTGGSGGAASDDRESRCKRDALISRAEEFRKDQQKEERRLLRAAREARRRQWRERQKAELERDINPAAQSMRDFVVSDSDRDSDGDYSAEVADPESGSSEEGSAATDDEGEYSPRHHRPEKQRYKDARRRRVMRGRNPVKSKAGKKLVCTCMQARTGNANVNNERQSDGDSGSSDEDASFHIDSDDGDSDTSSELVLVKKQHSSKRSRPSQQAPSSPSLDQVRNTRSSGSSLPRMTIHATRAHVRARRTASVDKASQCRPSHEQDVRPSPLNRSFTSERREEGDPMSLAKSEDMEMQRTHHIEPPQTSRDSFTNKDRMKAGNQGGDIVMRWSVQSAARDIEMAKNFEGGAVNVATPGTSVGALFTRRSSRIKSGTRSGVQKKHDSDSDFDLEAFSRQEVEELNSKTDPSRSRSPELDERQPPQDSARRGKRNRSSFKKPGKANHRKTRSQALCPVHCRKRADIGNCAVSTAPPDECADSDDSEGSVRISRRRQRSQKQSKRRKTNQGEFKSGSGALADDFETFAHCEDSNPLLASEWLRATSGSYNYIPQRGDVVYFFPQGHAQAIAHSKTHGVNPLEVAKHSASSREKPRLDGSKLGESVGPLRFSILSVSYEFPRGFDHVKEKDRKKTGQSSSKAKKITKCPAGRTVAMLTLRQEQSGNWPKGLPAEVSLPYYPVDDVPEYLVLGSRVEASLACNWKPNDKFRMLFVNEKRVWQYYTGVVRKVNTGNSAMGWNSVEVEYDNEEDPDKGALDKVSPWELEPVSIPQNAYVQTPAPKRYLGPSGISRVEPGLFIAIAREVENIRSNDPTCKTNMSWLQTVGTLCNSPEYCRRIACPINLDVVLTRLCTGFYRHFFAFVDDIELLWTNAVNFNGRDSDAANIAHKVYSYLLNVGERTRQKLSRGAFPAAVVTGSSSLPRDPKARAYSNDGYVQGALGMGNVPLRSAYVPLAPRLPSVGFISPGGTQGSLDVMAGSSPAHLGSRGVQHLRSGNVLQAMMAGAASHAGISALPPVVPPMYTPSAPNLRGNTRSHRPSGRIAHNGRLNTSPVHRSRALGSASMPVFPPHTSVPGGQVASTQTLTTQPSALVHSSQRMMPPAQVPIAPRTAARSTFSHGANNFSTRVNFVPSRTPIVTSNSLSTLMGPAVLVNNDAAGISTVGSNAMYTNYGAGRQLRSSAMPDGGTQSCGGSMEAAGGGFTGQGSTSESRIPNWPQQSAHSPTPPSRSVVGGPSNGVNNVINSATNVASSTPVLYQEHSSISIAAAESTMSCGGENGPSGAAMGESTETGHR